MSGVSGVSRLTLGLSCGILMIINPDPGTLQASATDRNATGSGIAQARWLEIISLNDRVVPENLSFISSYGIVGLCRSL